jgi:hypothetical protein
MKTYIKSLFPWRWIVLLPFILLTLFAFGIGNSISPHRYDLELILTIPFWITIDFVFGVGQENYWTRNQKNGRNE